MSDIVLPRDVSNNLISQQMSFATKDSVSSYFYSETISLDTLTKAAEVGDLEEVKRLLDSRSLVLDIAKGDQIELGGPESPVPVDINAPSIEYSAPIHAAVKNEHESVVRYLLTQPGIDVNVVDTGGYTPLLLAAEIGNLNILKELFRAPGVDKHAMNKYEEDVLMCAAKTGHLELVRYLVPRVENLSKECGFPKNQLGYTAVSLAASGGHVDVVEHLTAHSRRVYTDINAKTEPKQRTMLMLAAMSGNLDLVRYILNTDWCQPIDLNAIDSKGSTVLMLAAAAGHANIVEELCKSKAKVRLINQGTGFNALMLASLYGHDETVKVLMDWGDKELIRAKDHQGRSALFLAAQWNRLECVRAILEKDSSSEVVNAVTHNGTMTPLTATYDPEVRLQLIKAKGCDVSTVSEEQTDLRRNIRQAIKDVGERNKEAWSSILNETEDYVLPILTLMAEDATDTDIKEGFWKYTLVEPIGREYRSGERRDSDHNNTLYHYLARSKYASNCTRIISTLICKDNLASILKLKNKRGNTMLHTAALFANLVSVFKVIKEKMGGIADQSVKSAFKIENNDLQTFLAVAVKSTSEECVGYIQDIMDTLMNLSPRGFDMNFIYKTCDTAGNTLLHLAAKRAKYNMISYLADKPIDERAKNDAGYNPLHIAVLDNNYELFEHIFRAFKHRFSINEPTEENETVLHIAAKQGNVKMLEKFVELGGDLAGQDNDGHTPLHDCLQRVHLEGGSTYSERCCKFKTVWNKVIQVAVVWWCGPSFLSIPIPDEDSQIYQDFKRDAAYYLRSIVRNNKGYSVLQYAAYLGLTACVETMLTQEDVFVRKQNTCNFEIEISNLLPEYVSDIVYTYEGYGCLKDQVEKKRKYKGQKTTLIETLAEVKPPLKASEILQCVPMSRLTKWQWYIYQVFSIVWLVVHCTVMGLWSRTAQTEIRHYPVRVGPEIGNNTLKNDSSWKDSERRLVMYGRESRTSDILILIYALVIFILMTILPISRLIKHLKKRKSYRKIPRDEKPSYKIYHEYVVDKGAILSGFTYLLAFIVEQMSAILPLCFAVSACWLFYEIETKEDVTMKSYAWKKGNFLLFGWLLVLIPARTYSPIYNFLSTLKFIIIKDMLPFVLFHIVITVAFSCAIQLQFQLLTAGTINEAEDARGFHDFFTKSGTVLYELVIMTTGMDTDLKHVQNVADLFHEDRQNSMYVEALLIMYGIISVVILLNMLIAMMGTTLSTVVEQHGTGWRQYQVVQALRIRNFLSDVEYCCRQQECPCCTNKKPKGKEKYSTINPSLHHYHQNRERRIIFDKIMQRNTRHDELTDRWYLKLTRFELKDIRAKYWQYPEAVEVETEDSGPVEAAEDGMRIDFNEANEDEIRNMMEMDREQVTDIDVTDYGRLGRQDKSVEELEHRLTSVEARLQSMENNLTSKLENIVLVLSQMKAKA